MRLLIALALAAAPALAEDCAWKEGRSAPAWEVKESTIRLSGEFDREFFACAKKAGGTLTQELWLGHGGKLEKLRGKAVSSTQLREAAYQSDLCGAKPQRDEAQVRLVGTGAMEKLSWTSPVVSVHCARCEYRGDDNMLVLHANVRGDQIELEGTVDEEWHKCAQSGSTLEGRFYTGETSREVQTAGTPVFVLKGLESDRHFKRSFPRSALCKGNPKFVAYELVGTGEMAVLSGQGRGVDDPRCK